jgi:hypothetical protein
MTAALPAQRFLMPMPKHVLGLGLSKHAAAVIADAVGLERVKELDDSKQAEAHLLTTADACLVVTVPGDTHERSCEALLGLRERFPHVPMVAIYLPSTSSCRTVLRLGAAGVTQIVTGEPVLGRRDLMLALSKSHGEGVAIRLWRHSGLVLPEPLVPVLKAALRLAHFPITAESLGDATGMHERSLRKYCTQHRLPSPQWIIGWARLLIASFYLDEPGRTVAQVASILDFPSACALRNQLKRYSALATRPLRAHGTSRTIARRLEDAVNAHQVCQELSETRRDT